MEIALYLAKACGLTAVFYLAYHLLLRKETFFKGNRWFLLAGMAASALLPLAVYTKVVWVTPTPVPSVKILSLNELLAAQTDAIAPAPPAFELQWWMAAVAVYSLVAAFLLARLLIDFKKITALFSSHTATRFGRFKIIDSEAAQSPFSFFNYIVYNSASLEPGELQGIISHEKVHSSQHHSIDMLLAQLFCTAFWFNPFAWLYKKAISQNLEFIADAEAIKHVDDATAYQKTLLKITLNPQTSTITSHFYQPLIKKRIIMINKPKSKKRNSVKYAVMVPLLVAFVGFFQVKTEAREKSPEVLLQQTPGDTLVHKVKYSLSKGSKDEIMKENMALITNTFGIEASCNAERNENNEISYIKITLSGKGIDKVYEERNTNGIKNLAVEVSRDANGALKAYFSNPITLTVTESFSAADSIYYKRDAIPHENILYVIDGVRQPAGSDLQTLNVDVKQIASINVYKDQQIILDKFGEEAKDGVIEITTRKDAVVVADNQLAPQDSSIIVETKSDSTNKIKSVTIKGAIEISDSPKGAEPDFRLVQDGNSGFVLRKENTENDLDFFAKALKQSGITMKYSGIRRNGKGEITKIKITLSKKDSKSEAKFESDNGIENIYIGEKNGSLVAYSMK